ncbi:MAG: 50S ribosomal protein L20 [Elusimicrobia bacterium]|nr:50S ribosomal protein L20 [Elusimicrobiota bacterium]
MRIKGGVVTRRRKKRLFKKSKGFRLSNKNVYIHASERVDKALVNAYVGRIQKKRDKRSQWILTLNAAARLNGLSYSRFISGIKKAGITLNRKMLAALAVSSPEDFVQLAEIAKSKISAEQSSTAASSPAPAPHNDAGAPSAG